MSKILPFTGLLLGLAACQTSRPFYPTGIYTTAAAFRQRQPSLPGTQAGRAFFQRKAFVVSRVGGRPRTKVPFDNLWGYAGADGRAYRVFQRREYQVEQADTLTIYSQLLTTTATPSAPQQFQQQYYFSAGPDGPVQVLSMRRLKRTFATNRAFLSLLKQRPWLESLVATDRQPGTSPTYRLVRLYRQSLALPAQPPR